MNSINYVATKNIIRRTGRSIILMILSAILSVSIFSGSLIIKALQNGFESLERRLGADIMIVPYEATTKSKLEDIVLQGNTGYFYMDSKYVDEMKEVEGVDKVSPQYYLASVKAGCCSIPVQIIGFDPNTDFSVTPWIKKSNGGEIGYMDVVVGNDLNAFVGDTMSFFGVEVNVVAKLDKTGTDMDTEVFTTTDTIKTLIDASVSKELNEYGNINSGNVVSCIMIDVKDNYNVDEVVNDINIHNKKIEAIRATNLISGVSDSLTAISKICSIITVVIWIIALGIMIIAYTMLTAERKKEFAILLISGASQKMISKIVLTEGFIISFLGSLIGIFTGCLLIIPFSGYIETSLQVPFLIPDIQTIILIAVISMLLSCLSCGITAAVNALRISRIDAGCILREGE
ncbi:MAG: FtsX-like permease family protein [Lachnospiraceae bacterium]|nr:FtsX-like permease family protein [Lachnospiraceae bacterium]